MRRATAVKAPRQQTTRQTAPRLTRVPRRPSGVVAVPAGVGVRAPARVTLLQRFFAIADHRLVRSMLHGRAWIWFIGVALGGIVAMQVSLLKLNATISQTIEKATVIRRDNAVLEARVAELSSPERVRTLAEQKGMAMPSPGDVRYVDARPKVDVRLALQTMRPARTASVGQAAPTTPTATMQAAPTITHSTITGAVGGR